MLAKYGLEEKAMERLREALRLQPRNLNAYARWSRSISTRGATSEVVELANTMARIAAEIRDAQVWPKTRRQLLEAGYRLDGDRVVADPHAGSRSPPPGRSRSRAASAPRQPRGRAAHLPSTTSAAELEAAPAPPGATQSPRGGARAIEQTPPRCRPRRAAQALLVERPACAACSTQAEASGRGSPRRPGSGGASGSRSSRRRRRRRAPEPPAPPPRRRAEIFNPLEIGEMIESEDFDWEPPSGVSVALRAPPPPPAVSGQAACPRTWTTPGA